MLIVFKYTFTYIYVKICYIYIHTYTRGGTRSCEIRCVSLDPIGLTRTQYPHAIGMMECLARICSLYLTSKYIFGNIFESSHFVVVRSVFITVQLQWPARPFIKTTWSSIPQLYFPSVSRCKHTIDEWF